MIFEIPLRPIIKQQLTTQINNQTINITISGITVNNKELQDNTPNYTPTDEIIGGVLVPKSSIKMMADIQLGQIQIINNGLCLNAAYLNLAPSALVGYLFFYRDNWQSLADDSINYQNFGANGDTHLYYTDYDALNTDFLLYVDKNKDKLLKKYVYGYNS